MNVIQIVIVGIIASVLAIIVKKQSPEFAMSISIMASIIIFLMILPKLTAVVLTITNITDTIDINENYINIIFKIIGIAYIAEFGSQICQDAGQTSISSKIDMGAKVLIMSVSAPILLSLLDLIVNLIP